MTHEQQHASIKLSQMDFVDIPVLIVTQEIGNWCRFVCLRLRFQIATWPSGTSYSWRKFRTSDSLRKFRNKKN